MSPTVFVTGVSGYIGGHVTLRLLEAHPEYTVKTLVRDESQAGIVKAAFPNIATIIGDLDAHQTIVDESKKVDLVLNLASADHLPFVKSALEGLSSSDKSGSRAYFIHTSGSGVLATFSDSGPGYEAPKVFSDVADIREITGGRTAGVFTAIVCPPTIHGVGKGPLKKRSLQIPWLTQAILERGKGFTVGPGENWWDHVHIDDLAAAYVLLAEQALEKKGGDAAWGDDGYFFVESGEYQWATVAKSISSNAHTEGAITAAEVDALSVLDASALHPWAPLLWGSNCRSRADRLRALGWTPKVTSMEDSIKEMVAFEVAGTGPTGSKATFDK